MTGYEMHGHSFKKAVPLASYNVYIRLVFVLAVDLGITEQLTVRRGYDALIAGKLLIFLPAHPGDGTVPVALAVNGVLHNVIPNAGNEGRNGAYHCGGKHDTYYGNNGTRFIHLE